MQSFPLDRVNKIEAGFLDIDTLEKLKISLTPNILNLKAMPKHLIQRGNIQIHAAHAPNLEVSISFWLTLSGTLKFLSFQDYEQRKKENFKANLQ